MPPPASRGAPNILALCPPPMPAVNTLSWPLSFSLSAEAAITSQAGHRNQPQQQHTEEAGGQEGGIGASTISTSRPLAAASVGGGISVSGDFHFWLALLRTLMPHVQQLAEEQAAASSQLADAVR